MVNSQLSNLKRNKHTLFTLKDASPKLSKAILQNGPDSLIEVIIEIAENILEGRLQISRQKKDSLEKYKNVLRTLSSPKSSIKKSRKVLIQKGGSVLPMLLATVLGSIIEKILKK